MTYKEAFEKAGHPAPKGTAIKGGGEMWVAIDESRIHIYDPIFHPASGWDFGVPMTPQYWLGWNTRPDLSDIECDYSDLPKAIKRLLGTEARADQYTVEGER